MIGRPQSNEAAPYYFTYINQMSGEDAFGTLERQLEDSGSAGFLAKISEEKAFHRYAPDKWSIKQVLNHVSDTERSLAFRSLWFARGFETPLPSYDQNIAASGAEADAVSWSDHIEEFRRVRLSTLSLFRNLPSGAWTRSGIASDNTFTVRALAYIIAGHSAHHFRILHEKYL